MASFYHLISSSLILFYLVYSAVLLIASEVGRAIGVWYKRRNENRADEGAGLAVGSILGLLAFVLALTLSNASARFSQRQSSTLAEANAISTAWLQAGAVGGARAATLQSLIGQYIAERHRFISAPANSPDIEASDQAANALQGQIWAEVTALVAETQTPLTSSLMNATNNMFDASTETHFAMDYRMPAQIIFLMLGLSVVGMGGVGYQLVQLNREGRMPTLVLALVWCVVVGQIIDVGMARIWTMQTDVRVYEWTAASMGVTLTGD